MDRERLGARQRHGRDSARQRVPSRAIEVDPAAKVQQARAVTILLHKPVGYVSGQAEDGYEPATCCCAPSTAGRGSRADRVQAQHLRGLAPAGRLDIDSTGLLVFTQDGRIAKQLVGQDSDVEKEYLVRVEGTLSDEGMQLLRHGLDSTARCSSRRGCPGRTSTSCASSCGRPQAPDPPHVRAGRPRGDGSEARAHRACRWAVAAGPMALPAARREILSGWTAAVHLDRGRSRAARAGVPNAACRRRSAWIVDDTLTADHAYGLACEGHGAAVAGRFPEREAAAAGAGAARRPQAGRPKQADAPRARPSRLSTCTGWCRRNAPARSACCWCLRRRITASLCAVRRTCARPAPRPMGPAADRRWCRCANCWGSSVRTNGAPRVWSSRRGGASIRTTACSRRSAANTWIWWRRRRCPAVSTPLAFDIGTGTGVLAALLAHAWRRAGHRDRPGPARARLRARQLRPARLGDTGRSRAGRPVSGRAGGPDRLQSAVDAGAAQSPLEHAIYDPDSRMLRGFLAACRASRARRRGLADPSDLAEHLGLRTREECRPMRSRNRALP